MFLSRIPLNIKRKHTIHALASPHILHGAVETSFSHNRDGKRERVLWRVDYLKDMCYLLVLSPKRPEFLHIARQFGYDNWEYGWETRDYSLLLDRLQNGQTWRFRLRANPVRSSNKEKDGQTGRGKVFAHVTQQQQKEWLIGRAQAYGFFLKEDTFDVVNTEWKKFRKEKGNKREVTLRIADFEGILTISDAECFKKTLLFGIGRAKAYGCGLLTIARWEGNYNE